MKRLTLGFSILAATSAIILSCKKEPNVAPVPDTETQSAVYASFATFIASDIDQVCSFLGGDQFYTNFYVDYPGTASGITGTVTAIRDTNGVDANGHKIKSLRFGWNHTKCLDGFERHGTIFMNYGLDPDEPNAKYIQKYKFSGQITFSDYKVNGWLVELADPANPMRFMCTIPSATISPLTTNLTWKLIGKLKLTHPTDPSKNMIWETQGLTKTLVNTSDPKVFDPNPNKQAGAITWSLAVVKYEGKVFGNCPRIDSTGKVLEAMAPFTMTVNPNFALTRDFKCFPIKVSGVTLNGSGSAATPSTQSMQHHPFNQGMTSFTVGTYYPREIYFGNEGSLDSHGNPTLPLQCDNTGEVMIKGNTYRVNFMN